MSPSTLPKELNASDKSIVTPASSFGNGSSPEPIPKGKVTAKAVAMGMCASIGGFMFGYEAGQIGGINVIPYRADANSLTIFQVSWP